MKWFVTVYPNLRAEAARRNVSMATLAEVLGISVPALRRRLLSKAQGGTDFSPFECHVLCDYFSKPFDELFETSGDVA